MFYFFCLFALVSWLWVQPYDDTDNKTTKERSGLRLYTDHKTGCQYLVTLTGSITPRLNNNGKNNCGKSK